MAATSWIRSEWPPRRVGEEWEWPCVHCGAVMRGERLPAEGERRCLFCPAEDSQKGDETMNQNGSTALVRHERTPMTLEFSAEQRKMIRESYAKGANDEEFAVLMAVAAARRLNPLMRQIYFVPRKDNGRQVWTPQVSIDGLRAIAERSGLYNGQDEPVFEEDKDGRPTKCTVRVYRKDWERPAVGVAYFKEFVQAGPFWSGKPHVMLAKVAESIAIRKAFPEDTAGIYGEDEMPPAEAPREVPAERVQRARKVREVLDVGPAEAARIAQGVADADAGRWAPCQSPGCDKVSSGVDDGGIPVCAKHRDLPPQPPAPPSSGAIPPQPPSEPNREPPPDDAQDVLQEQSEALIASIEATQTRSAARAFRAEAKSLPEPFRSAVIRRGDAHYAKLPRGT